MVAETDSAATGELGWAPEGASEAAVRPVRPISVMGTEMGAMMETEAVPWHAPSRGGTAAREADGGEAAEGASRGGTMTLETCGPASVVDGQGGASVAGCGASCAIPKVSCVASHIRCDHSTRSCCSRSRMALLMPLSSCSPAPPVPSRSPRPSAVHPSTACATVDAPCS